MHRQPSKVNAHAAESYCLNIYLIYYTLYILWTIRLGCMRIYFTWLIYALSHAHELKQNISYDVVRSLYYFPQLWYINCRKNWRNNSFECLIYFFRINVLPLFYHTLCNTGRSFHRWSKKRNNSTPSYPHDLDLATKFLVL